VSDPSVAVAFNLTVVLLDQSVLTIGPNQSRWAGQFKGWQWADGRVRQDSRVGQSRWAGQSPLNRAGHRGQDVALGISVAFFWTVVLGRSSRTVGFGQSVAMGQIVTTVRRSRWADPGPGRTLALGRTVALGQWDGQSPCAGHDERKRRGGKNTLGQTLMEGMFGSTFKLAMGRTVFISSLTVALGWADQGCIGPVFHVGPDGVEPDSGKE
jgi:hypothetical protein